jgi:hypothetical protein
MPLDADFSPYRLPPGTPIPAPPPSAVELLAAPLVAAADALPPARAPDALAELAAGLAAPGVAPCLAADGHPSGMGGAARACPSSAAQREAIARAARSALAAGFAGVLLDRPDAPHVGGLLGAGFCTDCQRAFLRQLAREYGDHFEPIDHLRLARTAVADAPGAVTFEQLPFGRDFWRWRHDALEAAIAADVRAARDAGREAGRAFEVAVQYEAVGPSQLRTARLADAVVFPALVPPAGPGGTSGTGIGLFRLLRAVMGRRPVAVASPAGGSAAALGRLAAVAATCGVELSGFGPAPSPEVADVRRLSRQLAAAGRSPSVNEPWPEAAILYSAEADLWTAGRHLQAVLAASEALSGVHVQAPVVTRVADVPRDVPLVLADAAALAPVEANLVLRRLEAGGAVLAFGPPASVDETGRAHGGLLPAGKPAGVRVGAGTLAELPPLAPLGGGEPPAADDLEKALNTVLGRGRRAAGVASRQPVLVVLDRTPSAVHAHLVALGPEKAQGATLFLGVKVVGGVRRARFVSSDGDDVRIPMNPSGYSLSTVLPSWRGYAVLSLAP